MIFYALIGQLILSLSGKKGKTIVRWQEEFIVLLHIEYIIVMSEKYDEVV